MKFNVSYFGPEPLFHLRHDFTSAIKYGLEGLGHDAILSGAILSEAENDPAGYPSLARTARSEAELAEALADLLADNKRKRLGEENHERFRTTALTDCLAEFLDASFAPLAAPRLQ